MPAVSQWQGWLNEEEKESIGGQITVEETRSALRSLKTFKAPRSDSMHAAFFQRFWPTVGKSIVREVKRIFLEKKVPKYLNQTHIALIP